MQQKRGQLALFVIIAVIIIAAILLLLLYPKISPFAAQAAFAPQSFLTECIKPRVQPALDLVSRQGGFENPQGYLLYQGEKIKYLCYTAESYKTCIIQEPFIKERMEQELTRMLKSDAQTCMRELQAEYERRGYSVAAGSADFSLSFNPHYLDLVFIAPITVTKESTQTFREFSSRQKSEMYDLLLTATSIITFEAAYGDSETTLYLQYYPDLSIQKTKLDEGSKVYKIQNPVSGDSFTFASRSLAWPAGYSE